MLRRSPLTLIALAGLSTACGSTEPDSPQAIVATANAAVQGGVVDTADTNIVGIAMLMGGGIASCSGSLIAPNVVLTARHCVAQLASEQVSCSTSKFGANYPASSFYVTTHGKLEYNPQAYRRVSEVRTVPGGNGVCGYDVAILILDSVVPDSEATVRVPRITGPAVKGEKYSAVGFGLTCEDDPTGTSMACQNTAGTRHRRDGLTIRCVGADCKQKAYISDDELLGDQGACSGDSGGPALGTDEEVIGILSRGGWSAPNICDSPVYSQVYPWKDFIVQAVIDGAQAGGYAVPAWAAPEGDTDGGTDTDAAGGGGNVGDPCAGGTNCPQGQLCVSGEPNFCTLPCTDASQCPDGWSCTQITDAQVCTQTAATPAQAADPGTKSSKCSVSPGRLGADPTKPTPWIVGLLGLAALARVRRRAR